MASGRNDNELDTATRYEKLKAGASNLSINLQMQFWAFVSNQAKYLIERDSSVFYDVVTQSAANPLSSPTMVDVGGGVNVAMRSLRVLLVPFQKALQYGAWYNANQEYEANYHKRVKGLEDLLQPKTLDPAKLMSAANPAEEASKFQEEETQRVARINNKLLELKEEYTKRDPNNVRGVKKPTFTTRDGLYLALDVVLLALAIAALVYGVSIAGAAISTAAAAIGLGAAAINYGKHLHNAYKVKQEKKAVQETLLDLVLEQQTNRDDKKFIQKQRIELAKKYPDQIPDFDKDYKPSTDKAGDQIKKSTATLTDDDVYRISRGLFIEEQREKLKQDNPNGVHINGETKAVASLSPQEVMLQRSEGIEANQKLTMRSNYQAVRKTLGFTLTALSVVSASLILGGLVLGPYGAPVIAAGVALAAVTTAIVVGMMISNWVKNYRDKQQERASQLTDAKGNEIVKDFGKKNEKSSTLAATQVLSGGDKQVAKEALDHSRGAVTPGEGRPSLAPAAQQADVSQPEDVNPSATSGTVKPL